MKKKIINLLMIFLLICFTILPFIKIYHEVAILPGYDEAGNWSPIRKDFYFTAVENIKGIFGYVLSTIIVCIFLIMCLISAIFMFYGLFKVYDKKQWIFFTISAVLFSIIMISACFVFRCY